MLLYSNSDYDDLPSSYGNPANGLNPDLYLGVIPPDGESDSPGDDAIADGAEDDGVIFSSASGPGIIDAQVTLTNNTGGIVFLCGWMDINLNGTFEIGEEQCASSSDTNPTFNFQWSGLPAGAAYTTYARFRVAQITLDGSHWGGILLNGEVEGYVLDADPTAVTIGKVELEAIQAADFLSDLNISNMSTDALLELLAEWDAELAASLSNADRQAILEALLRHLDPDGDGQLAVLRWDTLEERGTIGFFVERKQADSDWIRINDEMLPGLITAPMGGEYQLANPSAQAGQSYLYQLIELEARGTTRTYGPFNLEMDQ